MNIFRGSYTLGFESQLWHLLCIFYMVPCFPFWDWHFNEALHRRCLSQDLSTVHMEFSVKYKWLRCSGYLPGAIHSSIPGLAHLIFAKAPWVMCFHQPHFTDVLTKAQGGEHPCQRLYSLCHETPQPDTEPELWTIRDSKMIKNGGRLFVLGKWQRKPTIKEKLVSWAECCLGRIKEHS